MKSIKDLFRTAAKATHPDHGGDPEAFRAVKGLYDAACRADALGYQSAFSEDEHANTAHTSDRASTRQARERSERNTDRHNQNSDYYDNLAREQGAQNHAGFRAWCKWNHRNVKDGRAWFEYQQARANEAANAPRQTGAGRTVRGRNGNQSSASSVDWPSGSAGVDQSSFVEWYQSHHESDECGVL